MGPPRDSEQTADHPSLLRASFPLRSSPRQRRPASLRPHPFHGVPLPQYRETTRCAQSAAPHHPPILLKKTRWGEVGVSGGRRAPCAPAKGPSFPPKPATSALLSALAKAATDFYTCVLAGRPHGMPPCPAARGRKRPSRRESARSSPVPIQVAMHAGKRCPRACPGPFFTISPLQPSSRGCYELYQGRCLEISCGAPPR